MPNIRDALKAASAQLQGTLALPVREATGEARMLLGHVLGDVPTAWLIAHDTDPLAPEYAERFHALLARRLQGEPMAYLLGQREFYGLPLRVTPATLIPRPDTETLVEAALQEIPQTAPWRILDLGTGSGAIALAIAHQRPAAHVVAIDVSPAALTVAEANAASLAIRNVHFRLGSWFTPLQGEEAFDVIVSNPPYIRADDEHLRQGDLRFEPLTALASGEDGLEDIRRIAAAAPGHLTPGGWLMLEHGYDQADAVAALLQAHGFSDVHHTTDLAGIRRVTAGRKTL